MEKGSFLRILSKRRYSIQTRWQGQRAVSENVGLKRKYVMSNNGEERDTQYGRALQNKTCLKLRCLQGNTELRLGSTHKFCWVRSRQIISSPETQFLPWKRGGG